MAFSHVRHGQLLVFLGPMLVARAAMDRSIDQDVVISRFFDQRKTLLVGAAVCIIGLGVIAWDRSSDWKPRPEHTPVAALEAARRAGAAGNVLNDYDFGGFLISVGVPNFIDGRSEFFGDAFLKTYIDAILRATPERVLALLELHEVTWTILRPDRKAVTVLDQLPGWERLYTDANAVVHVRGTQGYQPPAKPYRRGGAPEQHVAVGPLSEFPHAALWS
jgi:hypothetical protein